MAGCHGDFRFRCQVIAGVFYAGQILAAYALDGVMGGVQVFVGYQHYGNFMPLLYFCDGLAFFIEQESGCVHGQLSLHPAGILLEGLFFDDSKNGQRQRFNVPYITLSLTAGADLVCRFSEGRAQPLAGHFQQSKPWRCAQSVSWPGLPSWLRAGDFPPGADVWKVPCRYSR